MLLSITFLFFLSFTSVHTQPTTTTYTNCNTTFSCGSIITNLSYPFTGGNRPSYCGPPEYYLTCLNNATPILNHNRVTYQVLALDTSQTTLILSRSDLYNTTCPSEFRNTTLNVTLFNYMTPQNEMLSLFYGCNTSSLIRENQPDNLFTCDNYGERFGNYTDSYSLVGPVPSDPVLRFVTCGESISVPVMRSAAELMTSGRVGLVEALREGFGVNYSVPFGELCDVCVGLGGVCGFDSDLGEPVCICGDRRCPFVVTLPPQSSPPGDIIGNGSSKRGMQIGLSVAGAVIGGIGLGWLSFYCKQRKKQRVAAKTVSWEIQPSPSTKGLLNSHSAALVKSIPSYPSSKADIGADSTYFGVQVFDYCEIEEATDNFNCSRELGEGGFGTVYYGELLDGRRIAVKRMYENNFKRVEQFMNEVEILARLRHQHLVTLYGCTPKRSKDLLLVYEFIPNGTVADHLHGNRAKSGLLSWPVRLKIAIESAGALLYLHKSEIIHRDVKTTNILLDVDFHVKVADFGLSRLFPTNATHVSTAPQGTPGYVDPEYYQCYHLTDKSDVYSFGVVLIELISSLQAVDVNRHRHDINLSNMAINKIHNHKLHELVDFSLGFQTNSSVRKMMTLVAELAFRCLQQERDMRPSMEEVLESLRTIEKEDLNDHKVEIDILVDDYSERPREYIVTPSSDSVATNERSYGSNPH